MSAKAKEPGTCPFCAWDRPGDPPHLKGCVIGRHVEFARAEGVAEERARVVADLRRMAPTFKVAYRDALEWAADRIERGKHKDGA